MNKFSKILIGILVLPILIFGAEKKYNKSVNFPTLVFNYNKIDKKSKSELENIIDEIEKYKNDSQKIKIVVTAYTTDVAEDNADYVVETLEKSFKKKRITMRSLIAKDEDDATRNVNITLYMKIESDKDGDGVHIDNDKCPDTLANIEVDSDGCKIPDMDEDRDGIHMDVDKCPNTPLKAKVGDNGCQLKTVYCIVNSKTKTMRMLSELDDIKKGESVVTLYLDENGLYGDSEQDIQKIILNLL